MKPLELYTRLVKFKKICTHLNKLEVCNILIAKELYDFIHQSSTSHTVGQENYW